MTQWSEKRYATLRQILVKMKCHMHYFLHKMGV
jgi:hypothetical protein